MNHKSGTMAAIESLDQKLIRLLEQIEIATGGSTASLASVDASTNVNGNQAEAVEASEQNRSLMERLDQLLLSAAANSAANGAQSSTQEEIQNLSRLLSETASRVAAGTLENEALFADWQQQFDRMEQSLENLGERLPQPARFE